MDQDRKIEMLRTRLEHLNSQPWDLTEQDMTALKVALTTVLEEVDHPKLRAVLEELEGQ